MSHTFIFPIYNEQETIKETLLEWRDTLDKLQIKYEIIFAKKPLFCY